MAFSVVLIRSNVHSFDQNFNFIMLIPQTAKNNQNFIRSWADVMKIQPKYLGGETEAQEILTQISRGMWNVIKNFPDFSSELEILPVNWNAHATFFVLQKLQTGYPNRLRASY